MIQFYNTFSIIITYYLICHSMLNFYIIKLLSRKTVKPFHPYFDILFSQNLFETLT